MLVAVWVRYFFWKHTWLKANWNVFDPYCLLLLIQRWAVCFPVNIKGTLSLKKAIKCQGILELSLTTNDSAVLYNYCDLTKWISERNTCWCLIIKPKKHNKNKTYLHLQLKATGKTGVKSNTRRLMLVYRNRKCECFVVLIARCHTSITSLSYSHFSCPHQVKVFHTHKEICTCSLQ